MNSFKFKDYDNDIMLQSYMQVDWRQGFNNVN